MNPIVVIASHERREITSRNIQNNLDQEAKVVLVVSTQQDYFHYLKTFKDNVNVFIHPNKPLGAKWQVGVDKAVTLKADPLIITGSDDLLGKGFIKKACELVEQGNHFIGIQRFWQHKNNRAYLCDYKAHLPIGSGRVYSAKMLSAINQRVFDAGKDRRLDDLGWNNVRHSGLKVKWVRNTETEGLEVHAIKGDWSVMNPFTIKHKNIALLRTDNSDRALRGEHGNSFVNDDLAH